MKLTIGLGGYVEKQPGTFDMGKELRYWSMIVKLVFNRADTITVRLILANASLLWALGAILVPDTFQRHGYEIMRIIPRQVWAALFLLHFVGVYWRIFDSRQRIGWAIVVNSLGLVVWLMSTVLINIAIGEFAIGTSLEWILCFASGWALYRTGLQSEYKLVSD